MGMSSIKTQECKIKTTRTLTWTIRDSLSRILATLQQHTPPPQSQPSIPRPLLKPTTTQTLKFHSPILSSPTELHPCTSGTTLRNPPPTLPPPNPKSKPQTLRLRNRAPTGHHKRTKQGTKQGCRGLEMVRKRRCAMTTKAQSCWPCRRCEGSARSEEAKPDG